MPWVLGAPLPKKIAGRNMMLRIKSCLESGKSKSKAGTSNTEPGKRVLVRGNRRKRKPRRNTTKYCTSSHIPSPKSPCVQQIIEESPGRVTRSRLAMLMMGGQAATASQPQAATTSQPEAATTSSTQPTNSYSQPIRSLRRKLTPKKKLQI
uniref:Uncharacterized protein n=1 Tax=Oryza sativa subsp. japonica TaxID=39947 RepID=H2KWR1_ORYSJ|nr:hypothetical protein LOC_Os12g23869 [Oryza sativa Japonica Group]